MTADSDVIFSDRCVVFNNAEKFAEFARDPKAFLESIGALDGLPTYNGMRDSQAEILDTLEQLRSGVLQRAIVLHVVGPVPDFCHYYILR